MFEDSANTTSSHCILGNLWLTTSFIVRYMETNTNPPDEAAASAAVSSVIAKHVSKMALSLGGATILESAVSEIGIFDDDNKAVVGGDSDYNDEDLNRNDGGKAIKKRKVFQRFKKEDSLWWQQYLNTEAKATMEEDPDG